MMDRVLEPEVMDRPEEAREYDAMDHSAVVARFAADFLAAHGEGRGGELLDVGTGPGRIPIALCRADRHLRILGVDLAGPMLDLARRNVAEAGLTDRIRFARGDAKSLPFPDGPVRGGRPPTPSSTTSPTRGSPWPSWPAWSRRGGP